MAPIVIVETGLANIASMEASLTRMGLRVSRTTDADRVRKADRVVLPGVGAFGAAVPFLRETGLAESLRERITEGRPTLAICLGFQLMAERSQESEGVGGLGCIPGEVVRIPSGQRVPQLGWNRVVVSEKSRLVQAGYAYFANSYCLPTEPFGWACAKTQYGLSMVAAIERGSVLGCQFHPELSGAWGQQLLERWVCLGGVSC